ncbi:MAG TPA: ATP-grasp domain-containing protein, partial [Terriglobales bacterium]|nr:ATP-grasp domain-containing protein [Terriglobales bacterium]
MKITVLHESWSAHPLAWIHRAEARSIANELRHAGHETRFIEFREDRLPEASGGPLLLRLSDPVMQVAASALTNVGKVYLGPAAGIMERCYDKYEAYRVAAAHGVDCPVTTLAGEAHAIEYPVILKPRRSSDSLGLRLLRKGPMPTYFRTENYIAQEFVRGADLTVAVLRDRVGMPLRLSLPEGVPYSFWRKYLLRPPRSRVADASLAERVRRTALEIARIFAVNWAARIDFILETAADRLRFLECDV